MSIAETMERRAAEFVDRYTAVHQQIGRVIVGHDDIIHGVLTCLFVGGHCLLEGVPGLGKTLLVRTLAKTLSLEFNRVQFTPDLMPADILGTNMVMETDDGKRFFEFQRGPIFTQICLADEINRATPKTQSAMLETMQEAAVTAAGKRYQLTLPFFVMATQNPIEQEGTYPLPEAQLDRFFFKLQVGYSGRKELATIIDRTTRGETIEPAKVMDGPEILRWQELVREVILADHVRDYIVRPDAGHAPRRRVRVARHQPIHPLGRQSTGRPGVVAGLEGPGPVGRPLQRQFRGRPPGLSAGHASSHRAELRSPGRRHRAGQGAFGTAGAGAGEGGVKWTVGNRRAPQETQQALGVQGLVLDASGVCNDVQTYPIPPRGVEPLFSD